MLTLHLIDTHHLTNLIRGNKMKLTKEKYAVSKETLGAVLEALEANQIISDGEDEDSNWDVVEALHLLEAELLNVEGMK